MMSWQNILKIYLCPLIVAPTVEWFNEADELSDKLSS